LGALLIVVLGSNLLPRRCRFMMRPAERSSAPARLASCKNLVAWAGMLQAEMSAHDQPVTRFKAVISVWQDCLASASTLLLILVPFVLCSAQKPVFRKNTALPLRVCPLKFTGLHPASTNSYWFLRLVPAECAQLSPVSIRGSPKLSASPDMLPLQALTLSYEQTR